MPAGVDLEKETVITGRVVDGSGQAVGGAFVRLLDSSDEFTAEVVASATGDFRFFAAPGTWTVRALSPAGNGDAERGAVRRGHPRGRRQGRLTTVTSNVSMCATVCAKRDAQLTYGPVSGDRRPQLSSNRGQN